MAADASMIAQALAQALMPVMTQLTTVVEKIGAGGQRQNRLIDCRTLGRPRDFAGKQVEWREWSSKTASIFRAADVEAGVWLPWAEEMTETITDEVILTAASRSNHDGAKAVKFANEVYNILLDVCKDEAYNEVDNANGNGFEAWRLLGKRYSPRTPGTKRALILAIMNMKAARSVDELEKNIHHMEHLVKRYDAISKVPLDETVKTAVLVNLCPNEYKDYSDLTTQDYEYKEMKTAISNWMERKRDRDPAALRRLERAQVPGGQSAQPMDVDYLKQYHAWDPWWSQEHWDLDHLNNYFYTPENYTEENGWDLHAMQKGKGKGGKGKSGGKGKGPWETSGYNGGREGKGKGKKGFKGGKGKTGAGAKGGFHGECYHCGEWGHSQRWCEKRLAEEQRGKGTAYVMEERPQDSEEEQGKLEALEERSKSRGSWRCMNHVLGNLETSNRFAPLTADDDDDIKYPASENPRDHRHENPRDQRHENPRDHRHERITRTRIGAGGGDEDEPVRDHVQEINYLSDAGKGLEITVDSGASENVMGPSMAPTIPISTSPGSRAGVEYLAANGTTMRNQGEKIVPVITQNGIMCDLKMQITDVKRPLMSVARICDAGHRITFDSSGGVIESLDSCVKVPFNRVNNVYRLCVQVDDKEHFQRQG